MDDPDAYLVNSDPAPQAPVSPGFLIPWLAFEKFLTFLDVDGLGTIERWMNADESVHSIFLCLLYGGCDPFAAAALFSSSYCAPPGSFRVETEPENVTDDFYCAVSSYDGPVSSLCAAGICPRLDCVRHPNHTPTKPAAIPFEGEWQ